MIRRTDKDQNTNRKDGETRSVMHSFEVVVKNLDHFYKIVHYLNSTLGRIGWRGPRKTVKKFNKKFKMRNNFKKKFKYDSKPKKNNFENKKLASF